MNYERMTPEKFAENLSSGKYTSLAGARRAIGKANNWKSSQRDEARALAEKRFGTGDKPKAAAVAKKKPGPKPAKVKAAAAPGARKKPGPKPGTKRTWRKAAAATTSAAVTPIVDQSPDMMPQGLFSLTDAQVAANPHQAVSIADRAIQSASTGVATARAMKDKNEKLDITEIEETALSVINKNLAILDRTGEAIWQSSIEAAAKKQPPQLRVVPQPTAENGTPGEAAAETDDLIKRCADAAKAHHMPEPPAAAG